MNSRQFFLFLSPLLLGASLWTALHFMPGSRGEELFWDDDVRDEVQRLVDARFLEPLDGNREKELFDAAMRAYVGSLDPFSRYFTPVERRDLDEDTAGSFAGVGVQIRDAEPAGIVVTAVYTGGPADIAGIQPADVIVRVDDIAVGAQGVRTMVSHVKGRVGTDVVLWILRGTDAEPRPITVTRGRVDLDTVPAVRLFDGEGPAPVAYVRLSQFSDSTPSEVREQLRALAARGARGVVLDLRQNLGGVVSSAVRVAGIFLGPRAPVCVTRSRGSALTYRVESTKEEPAGELDVPLAVLVDQGSASASEILAGALQDHGRAVVVGARTYGKFLVQTLVPLSSSDALVRITTARYETPRGRSSQRNEAARVRGGLMPDVRVRLSSEEQRDLAEQFAVQAGPRWRLIEGRDRYGGGADRQLQTAIELLRGAAAPAESVAAAGPEHG